MRFIREHMFYVVLVLATAVGGVIALLYYFGSDLDKKLSQRKGVSGSLSGLARRRQEKVNAATVVKLKQSNELVRTAAKVAAQAASTFNRRALPILQLTVEGQTEDAFPIQPTRYVELSLTYKFIKQYAKALDDMLNDPALHRTTKATPRETKVEAGKLAEKYKDKALAQAVKSMKIKKAEAGRVFIENDAVDRYFRTELSAPPGKLWQAQVNLWVTREILQAIITTNEQLAAERARDGTGPAQASVLSSAVKQLSSLIITEQFSTGRGGFGGARGSLSERVSTADFGVIGYQFVVIMPTRHVQRLLRNLMEQNYHTAVDLSMGEVRRGENAPYYYGTEPVMSVRITGEMLLLMDWTRPLMPQEVQDRLPRKTTG